MSQAKEYTEQNQSTKPEIKHVPKSDLATNLLIQRVQQPTTPALDEHIATVDAKNAEFMRDGKVAILGAFYGRLIADLKAPALKSIIASFEAEYKKDKEKCSGIEYKETITRARERLKELEDSKPDFGSFNQTSVIIPKNVQ
jgi:hypothetical protein